MIDTWKELDKISEEEIREGARKIKNSNEYQIDMTKDELLDVIKTVKSECYYVDEINDNTHYFGYKLDYSIVNEIANWQERKNTQQIIDGFINWLKYQPEMTKEMEGFICRPLNKIKKDTHIGDFDLIVYPQSRGTLNKHIIRCIHDISFYETPKTTVEVIKNIPTELQIDWDAFKNDYQDDIVKYRARRKNLKKMLYDNKNLDYFSIGDIGREYRPYFMNFLKIDDKYKPIVRGILNGKVLIVDDISTSNSTAKEIARNIRKINPDCEIYIFTLISR